MATKSSSPRTHICRHEGEIAVLKQSVEKLEHVIEGNGQPGLSKTIPVLIEQLNATREEMAAFRTTVHALQESKIFMEAQEAVKEKERRVRLDEDDAMLRRRADRRAIALMIFTIVGSAISVMIVLWGTGILK